MRAPAFVFIASLLAAHPVLAGPGAAPEVTVELLEVDPAGAAVLPLERAVYGRIRYATDAPVRLLLLPYRDGQRVEEDGFYYGGSPRYAPGSGETLAWFAFHDPQAIDEIRAVAEMNGNVLAEVRIERTVVWRASAAAVPVAGWVDQLRNAPKNVVVERAPDSILGDIVVGVIPLMFMMVPFSVALQIYAWRKLKGRLQQLARISGCAMAALWLFVIVTGMAGSNLSPIWLVFLSPLFVLFLAILLVRSRRRRDDTLGPAP